MKIITIFAKTRGSLEADVNYPFYRVKSVIDSHLYAVGQFFRARSYLKMRKNY